MTIDEIIKKEEQKIKTLLFATMQSAFALLTAEEQSDVADSVHEFLQQNYLTLVNAIGHMAKLTKADTRACGDIVALASVVFSAVSERSHPAEAPQIKKLTDYAYSITIQQNRLMADTLGVLARQFRVYEAHHAHKGDHDKAESNASFAKLAETVVEMFTWAKRPSVTQQQIEAAVNAAKSPDKRSQPLDIPWDFILPIFEWATKNELNEVMVYDEKPELTDNGWTYTGRAKLLNKPPYTFHTGTVRWQDSLTKRPE